MRLNYQKLLKLPPPNLTGWIRAWSYPTLSPFGFKACTVFTDPPVSDFLRCFSRKKWPESRCEMLKKFFRSINWIENRPRTFASYGNAKHNKAARIVQTETITPLSPFTGAGW